MKYYIIFEFHSKIGGISKIKKNENYFVFYSIYTIFAPNCNTYD